MEGIVSARPVMPESTFSPAEIPALVAYTRLLNSPAPTKRRASQSRARMRTEADLPPGPKEAKEADVAS